MGVSVEGIANTVYCFRLTDVCVHWDNINTCYQNILWKCGLFKFLQYVCGITDICWLGGNYRKEEIIHKFWYFGCGAWTSTYYRSSPERRARGWCFVYFRKNNIIVLFFLFFIFFFLFLFYCILFFCSWMVFVNMVSQCFSCCLMPKCYLRFWLSTVISVTVFFFPLVVSYLSGCDCFCASLVICLCFCFVAVPTWFVSVGPCICFYYYFSLFLPKPLCFFTKIVFAQNIWLKNPERIQILYEV